MRCPRRPSSLLALGLLVLLVSGCGAFKRALYAGGDRDEWQQTERVVESLAILPGSHVADLGAGGGYFTFPLAEAVGPRGRVYAIDVDSDMTEFLREAATQRDRPWVVVVEATPDDPQLPERSVDLVFLCNTYHHVEDRVAYFRRLQEALRPGGRIAVVEFDQGTLGHATAPEVIVEELREAGYRRDAEHDYLSRQSFQVFVVDE